MLKLCQKTENMLRLFFIIWIWISLLFSKNILIVNSYSVQFPWTKGELEGILKTLKTDKNQHIYIEFMDTKLFRPTDEYIESFYKYISQKYKNIPVDIVITTDDNALNFVIKHKNDKIFKNSKVFFAGVNNLFISNTIDRNIYTGVFEKKEPLVNLNFAKKIVKNLKYVYVVADNSNSAKAVMNEYKNAFKNIKGIEFIYLNHCNLQEILQRLKNTPSNSAMLLLTPFSFHLNKKHIGYKKAVRLISKYFKHPIIIHTDLLANIKNSNIVGGKVTDSLSQGKIVAQKVLKYLNGKKISEIPLTYEKANKFYLNVLNLKKFGINYRDLNFKNTVLVNRPSSFFDKYKYLVMAVIIFILLLIFYIFILFNKLKTLKKNFYAVESVKKIESDIMDNIIVTSSKKEKIMNKIRDSFVKNFLEIVKKSIYEANKNKNFNDYISFYDFLYKLSENHKKISIKEILEGISKILSYKGKNIVVSGENFIIDEYYLSFFEKMFFILNDDCEYIDVILINGEINFFFKNCEKLNFSNKELITLFDDKWSINFKQINNNYVLKLKYIG